MQYKFLKYLLSLFLILVLFGFSEKTINAATIINFDPKSINATDGQNITLKIYLNPQGLKNYTAKIKVDFPSDLLSVRSFTYATGWIPINISGYDSIDNANGFMVKSAGYPKPGIDSSTLFGTVVFVSNTKNSVAHISVDASSLALDSSNLNMVDVNHSDIATITTVDNLPVASTSSDASTNPNTSSNIVFDTQNQISSGQESTTTLNSTNTTLASTSSNISTATDNVLSASVINNGTFSDIDERVLIAVTALVLIAIIYLSVWRPFSRKK